ncbi:hypothetical protein LIU39_32420, partial [Streptomyces sp. SF28]|nr:hypothetical protein [Streptomyces pinistramenti]
GEEAGAGRWLCGETEKRRYPHAAPLPGLLAAGRRHLQDRPAARPAPGPAAAPASGPTPRRR